MIKPLIRCANCGQVGFKVYSYHAATDAVYHYCSMVCKKQHREKLEEEENESKEIKEEASVLPELRSLIARKTDRGITVVRGDCET